MKRRKFIHFAGTTAIAVGTVGFMAGGCTSGAELKKDEILHTVIFDLKHPAGSAEANKFLTDAHKILTAVPGVINFQAYKQCSPKNDYQYGFLMKFKNQNEFDAYTNHPDHVKFVTERWDTEVSRFQESDFIKM